MIPATGFRGEPIAVLGLARSGVAAAQALLAGGAKVLAWDDAEPARDAAVRAGIPVRNLDAVSFEGLAALILSPGIPHRFPAPHPVVAKARAARVPLLGDIELLARACPEARYVGITGTNGKSTTTALIGHILTTAGRTVQVGGNLGVPALSLGRLGPDGVYVLELSSYQLELLDTLTFDVAILLNLTPDHLDRHGGMSGYIAAKRRIFARGAKYQIAIIGVDDAPSRETAEILAGENAWQVTRISVISQEKGGVYVEDGTLIDDTDRGAVSVMDLRGLPLLPGRHNWQNIAAAYAASRALNVNRADIVGAVGSFPGLAHRQELVATIDGTRWINDSKATNADASAKALACYDNIYWIAGGVPKAGGIEALAAFFPRIRHALLIGEAEASFARTLGRAVPFTRSGNLATAVTEARRLARGKDAVVLLSPACASFDQFADFAARGEAFRALVLALRDSQ
jgi:UDP-N-acetylmuramoylalanine--D-glutamate ligase